MKQWTLNRNGTLEPVALEKWAWMVQYKNGAILKQFDEQGVFHLLGEINQEEVHMLTLYKTGPEGEMEGRRIDLIIPEGARIIHRYHRQVLAANTPDEVRQTIYRIGYKLGERHQLHFVLPDDTIVVSENEVDFTT